MTKYGWSVEEDTFTDNTPFGPKRFTNIVATHNPKAPRRLVLSCHFDSKYFADIEFIGATDSAVPCAMLLDIARHLNTSLWTRGRPTVSARFWFIVSLFNYNMVSNNNNEFVCINCLIKKYKGFTKCVNYFVVLLYYGAHKFLFLNSFGHFDISNASM